MVASGLPFRGSSGALRPRTRVIAAGSAAAVFALAVCLALPPGGNAPPQFLEFLGRFHTLAVHLPIGVLLLVATAEVLAYFPRVRERIDPAIGLALPFLVATAVAAFSLGVLLARGGGYPTHLVTMHRVFTLGAVWGSAACFVAWSLRERPDGTVRRGPYQATLGLTVLLLTIGAHFGGSMTHGESYLTRYAPEFVQSLLGEKPAPAAAPAPSAAPAADPLVFADIVLPLMQHECVECHGPDKTKGGLRLDSLAAILKGGENGPDVTPGHGKDSPLVKRMMLPANDDDHMPPSEKKQPTADEVALVTWWIDRGADDKLHASEGLVPDGARALLGQKLGLLMAPSGSAATAIPTRMADPPAGSPAPATSSAPEPAIAAGGGRTVYRGLVAPILAARCGSCHGADKQKGKLRVDSIGSLVAGGKSGPAIVAGSGASGTLLTRVSLPTGDDKHMPPSDEPQLSGSQIRLLAWWAAHGADDTTPITALPSALASVGTGGVRPARATRNEGSGPPAGSTGTTVSIARAQATASSAAPPAPPIVAPPGHVALYQDVVASILVSRCGECHANGHSEGGMRVDDLDKLAKEKELVPGKPDDSAIVKRMVTSDKDDHMPPPDKPQPTPSELAAIRTWIAAGGTRDVVVAANDVPAELLPPGVAASQPQPTATSVAAAAESKPPGTVVPLRASGCGACTIGSSRGDLVLPWIAATTLGLVWVARRRRRLD